MHLNFDSSEALDRPLWDSDVGSCWAGMTRVEEDADPVGKFPKVTQFLLTPVGEPSQGSEPTAKPLLLALTTPTPLLPLCVEESNALKSVPAEH